MVVFNQSPKEYYDYFKIGFILWSSGDAHQSWHLENPLFRQGIPYWQNVITKHFRN